MNNEDRQLKRSIISRIVIITVIGVMLGLLVVTSFGWFSSNSRLTTTGMSVVVRSYDYDLLIEKPRRAVYDAVDGRGSYIYPDTQTVKTKLTSDGFNFTETDTSVVNKLAFEIESEFVDDYGKRFLRPGAYGKITFYIRPHSGDVTATFTFDMTGFQIQAGDTPEAVEVSDTSISNLLKGHFLFFLTRTGADHEHYRYSDLIVDGSFSYNTAEHDPCGEKDREDCYKIVIYWEWPVTYREIQEGLSGVNPKYPRGNAENSIVDGVDEYLEQYKDHFFIELPGGFGKSIDQYDRYDLINAYNDADQIIGNEIDYLVVYIGAN